MIIFKRHGKSRHNELFPGVLDYGDPEISEHGRDQSRDAARRFLARHKLGDVALSPSTRVAQTWEVACEAAELRYRRVIVHPGLAEYDWGPVFAGRPKHAVFTPAVQAQADREGIDFHPPGGESIRDCARRMLDAFSELGDDVGTVIGSNFAFKSLFGVQLGMSRQEILKFKIDNTEALGYDPFAPAEPIRLYTPAVAGSPAATAILL